MNRVLDRNCAQLPDRVFYHNLLCSELIDCRPTLWACCNPETGVCVNRVRMEDCERTGDTWHDGKVCADIDCPATCRPACSAGSFRYVDPNAASEVPDGRSWCTAFPTIEEGLRAARLGDTVRVADGRYTPSTEGLENPRKATFRLQSGLRLEGGYAGCGAPHPDRRDILGTPSILSGDLHGDDGPNFLNNAENVYHVVTAERTESTAVLDGFVVTGGNADGLSKGDQAIDQVGAGVYMHRSESRISRCLIFGNLAFIGASGLYAGGGRPDFSGTLIVANESDGIGAGAVLDGYAIAKIHNPGVIANRASGAAGVELFFATVELTSAILYGNRADYSKGISAQLAAGFQVLAIVNYCNIEGWDYSLPGVGTFGANPAFLNRAGSDGIPGTLDDDLRLRPDSPCIDAGDPDYPPDADETDIAGVRRVLCGRIDIGPFESNIGDLDCDRDIDLRDYALFQNCFDPDDLPAGCRDADVNADRAVDFEDYQLLSNRFMEFGGP